jgi:hypothetical protein
MCKISALSNCGCPGIRQVPVYTMSGRDLILKKFSFYQIPEVIVMKDHSHLQTMNWRKMHILLLAGIIDTDNFGTTFEKDFEVLLWKT